MPPAQSYGGGTYVKTH
ncbi:uncharacterized protein DNG_02618 [Cephalotrichum gorgonifer]|uniref:Uncharacterized protein n=1 Tax=Cephalotrichum gorgonifer TaxID=2041049 RepID=A0AAE8MU83_9PEZI|nr:uncharacterized protein DNG_02618 [Cephalotrichum gorgonifer]